MSEVTRQSILAEVGELEVDKISKSGDKYASFPYVTTVTWRNAVAYEHVDIREEAHNALVSDVTLLEIDQVFIATSVISAVLRKKIERCSARVIEDVYRELASSDRLSQKVLDDIESGDISSKDGGFILDALRSGDMFTDIANVNGLRLAANIAFGDYDLRNRFESSAKSVLKETMNLGQRRYERTLDAFGRSSPLEAARLFAGSFPLAVVGFAFPMESGEADRYLEHL